MPMGIQATRCHAIVSGKLLLSAEPNTVSRREPERRWSTASDDSGLRWHSTSLCRHLRRTIIIYSSRTLPVSTTHKSRRPARARRCCA